MKKVLFTILGFGLLSLNAQVKEKINYDYPQFKIVVTNESNNSNAKRDLGTGWFDYANAYNDFNGSGLSSSVYFIQPDTLLYTVGTDGAKNITGFHVLGRTNDPRDEVYSNNPERFSRHNTYTWDSIRFTQFYVRWADSMVINNVTVPIVDTVFIQYFAAAGLDNKSYYFQSDPSKNFYFSIPKEANYNKKTRLNSAAFKTDTIFLTKDWADSVALNGAQTTFFGRSIVAPVGRNIPHSATSVNANLVGHTIFFKPMKKPSLGDTGIAYNGSNWVKKYNMYGVRMFVKTGLEVENTDPQAQNHSIITNFQVSEGQTVSNIFKSYLSGVLWSSTIFEGTQYHLTTQTLGVNTVDANGNGIGYIYPNPSNSSNEVFVPVKLAEAQTVTLTICDITGKVVKTITADYAAGDFDIALSTADMSNGVYTCTMVAGDFKATTKFVVN